LPSLTPPGRAWATTACIAIVVPTLIAYNLPPSATFLNQAAAVVGWGIFLFVLTASDVAPRARVARLQGVLAAGPLLAALALVGLAAVASPFWTGLPWSLALSSVGSIAAALLAVACGAVLQRAGLGVAAFRAVCIALLVAGVVSALIALVQVFLPALADGTLIARSSIPGRAVGNMRQPNHLSSLLLWSIVAMVWLAQTGWLRRGAAIPLGALLLVGIVLSGSRTGAVGALVLALWGIVDRRQLRRWRWSLIAAPLGYLLLWGAMSAWARWHGEVAGVEAHFNVSGGDISSSRFAIWSNTAALIRMQPWTGVGFGEFNFAWTLTPFPQRPIAFFDHTHNLLMQFAVELGLPLAALVLGLMAWALWRAGAAAWRAGVHGEASATASAALRAAFVMVVMVALHSQLEYPLWYLYFLLPTAFVWGLCLGASGSALQAAEQVPSASRAEADAVTSVASATAAGGTRQLNPLALGGLAMWLAGLLSVLDYARVVVIFAPPEGAAPLAQRIAAGQRSVLFSHHADYAAATTATNPPATATDPMDGLRAAPHYLLDARLMQAWAVALERSGDDERARHVAARLKEFHNETAQPFFAFCEELDANNNATPFQCRAPHTALDYRDFRPR
jgi:O-antigen ligase